ncbi:uncharacterized protein Z520_02737 [Fonsecaea multimorphosa CBS 102226]|uniref:DUF7924 domain-containing protein n=1 Tax=Fonsecaea multimorphosa CBS 102226 TaxID=1442371 RepID=A0A0D2KD99_9EURO|nr:uncharacterized protein Z520_02737 [Fonsecaea multimorphosa CBS 102226]KIY01185.1 hypothetical protein Z520_02737 [Fonsecaea multimorphosa CBS 102226]OAL28797.1 hypothetical protein AYO22_02662 [Fonsecaea multimorphosa]
MRDPSRNTIISLRSHIRKPSSSTKSNVSEKRASFGSLDYRSTTLEPNHIIVEDKEMDDERWSRLAFALGMPYGETQRPSPEATKFAQQVRSRRTVSGKEMTDLLLPLLVSVAKNYRIMKCRTNTLFHRDGVPDEVPDFEVEDGWKMQLPTPRPTITLGYSSKAFSSHQLELQHGIISNSRNEPCNLDKLSQPVPDVYWPFFVVEVQDESMLAARNASAGSAATCNNALMIFAGAAEEAQRYHSDMNFLWRLSKAAQSFSLSINGKTACLNTHNSEGCLPHAVATIRTYRLDNDKDVESMAARISSILVWAENCRLQSISDLLSAFDKRVKLCREHMTRDSSPYDPPQLASVNGPPRSRTSIIRSVIAESLPRWARAF